METKVQSKIIKYLKSKGCYVIKTHPGLGTPTGCPDVVFMTEGFYGALECKASKNARFQPLQKETIEKLDDWSWAKVLYPENYDNVIAELDIIL
jgi:Holliday junction resolvase